MSKIYFCSLAVAFLFFSLLNVDAKLNTDQIRAMAKPWGNNCATKIGLSKELQEAHARGEFPENEELMCYLLCNAKASKIIDKTNKIDMTTISTQLRLLVEEQSAERMIKVFQTCADRMTATEPCRLAYDFSKCYYEVDAETYMFP